MATTTTIIFDNFLVFPSSAAKPEGKHENLLLSTSNQARIKPIQHCK